MTRLVIMFAGLVLIIAYVFDKKGDHVRARILVVMSAVLLICGGVSAVLQENNPRGVSLVILGVAIIFWEVFMWIRYRNLR